MTNEVEVWLDADIVPEPLCIGYLHHARGVVRFEYTRKWLAHPLRFAVDPELSLDAGSFYPDASQGNFRVFDDSAPDRWGQTLMKRCEAMAALDEGRAPRVLYAWDYFLGVQDFTRQGALRVCVRSSASDTPSQKEFLAHHPLPAPPFAQLRELEAVGRALSGKKLDDLDQLKRWLAVLVAPGASLGGARPKANFTDDAGQLWIAKFPAKDDERDVGAWEGLAHTLAKEAGIDVPEAKVLQLSRYHKTFCVQRFDRVSTFGESGAAGSQRRRFYASAMALLRKDTSEGASYLELAEFIRQQGAAGWVQHDLAQLFRRVIFNIAIGNRDDHLRNHGFILTATGWRLSPAFDLNPNTDKADHVLNIDMEDNRPSLKTALATAQWYGLSDSAAQQIADKVLTVTARWSVLAKQLGLSRAEIELYRVAFMTR